MMGVVYCSYSSELKPCDCGMPIDEYLRIQELWSGYGAIKVGVVYCSYCYNAKAFDYNYFSKPDEISKAAYKVWNTRTPSIEDIVDVVEDVQPNNDGEDSYQRRIIANIRAMDK